MQLHVVEELLQMLHCDDTESVVDQEQERDGTEQLAALSYQAVLGTESHRALRLLGWLGDKEVKLLIDSGSSSSFINQELIDGSYAVKLLPRRLHVKVADGGELLCTQEVPSCNWWSQGYHFCCDLEIISLGGYDIILGMDWLEFYSPMKVNWVKKFLQFEHQGSLIQLQGIIGRESPNQQNHKLSGSLCLKNGFVSVKLKLNRLIQLPRLLSLFWTSTRTCLLNPGPTASTFL